MNPVHICRIYDHKIRFNIILPSTCTSPKQSLSSSQIFQRFYSLGFPIKPLHISPMRPTWRPHPFPPFNLPNNTWPGVKIMNLPSRNLKCFCLKKFLFIWPANSSLTSFFLWHRSPNRAGRTPVSEWSARHRGHYLQNTQQTFMSSAWLEPATQAIKRPHTHAIIYGLFSGIFSCSD